MIGGSSGLSTSSAVRCLPCLWALWCLCSSADLISVLGGSIVRSIGSSSSVSLLVTVSSDASLSVAALNGLKGV